ncbi:snoRNA-binding protein [Malassezia vespertilionis]|uniref:H/ACA ribonucleoprotein complex subunit 2 n=1 Tax=Malassezia vespertilionis TaxID=2020962 RepID=A0A2N1JFE1_9BASI|nr:snoRNA-binding protein [Malassezia vespertilionis]PKI85284.1 Nhp2p [Malassezia vespertilionis]WFD05634.1 snoRNA-binding protein [Malassezia vespertilionis]
MAADEVKSKKVDSPAKKDKKDKKDKKEKKEKKEKKSELSNEEIADVSMDVTREEAAEADAYLLSPIASPLASEHLAKKVFKTVKKASKSRGHVKRGVKEVVKAIRKGEKGVVVLAGDISPIDIMSAIPVLCEDTKNPYVYVASKDQLGNASSTKRPTSCVMIVPGGGKKAIERGETKVNENYQEEYSYLHKEASRLVADLLLSIG